MNDYLDLNYTLSLRVWRPKGCGNCALESSDIICLYIECKFSKSEDMPTFFRSGAGHPRPSVRTTGLHRRWLPIPSFGCLANGRLQTERLTLETILNFDAWTDSGFLESHDHFWERRAKNWKCLTTFDSSSIKCYRIKLVLTEN